MFSGNNMAPSLSDIAAVIGNNNEGFGNGGAWWAIIILFALFGGFGNGGWGYNGNNRGSVTPMELQNGFNQQTTDGMLRSITYSLADTTYALNNTITSGFTAAELARANQYAANIQQINALQSQIADCCCQNREAVAQARYDNATNTNAITVAINQAAQAIMQNDNANYRQLHDENVAIQMAAKDDKIAELTAMLNQADREASQQRQNQYLVSELKQCPVPAYVVPNPNAGIYYTPNTYGNCPYNS